jgi:hypothetical protein
MRWVAQRIILGAHRVPDSSCVVSSCLA